MRVLERLLVTALVLPGCEQEEDDPPPDEEVTWQVPQEGLPGALLSVWGTSSRDVWAVGADSRDGNGPLVLHFDGDGWTRVQTGQAQGDLWWVFGFDGGPIFMGGDGGVILRGDGESFTLMDTPGTGTVFGIWGASPNDVWAVGGESPSAGGFAWRLTGDTWEPDVSVPMEIASDAAIWKMYGTSTTEAWAVTSTGEALQWDGATFTTTPTGVGSSLFTIYESGGVYAAVGGSASGFIVENDGSGWRDATPTPAPMGLSGVALSEDGAGIAVGLFGTVYTRGGNGWVEEELDIAVRDNLHGAWIDENGGLWAVGGNTLSQPLTDGVLIHKGTEIPAGGVQ